MNAQFFISEFRLSSSFSPTNFTVIDSYPAFFEDRTRSKTPIPKSFLHVVCQGKGLPEDGTIYACVFQRRKSASRILSRILCTKGERWMEQGITYAKLGQPTNLWKTFTEILTDSWRKTWVTRTNLVSSEGKVVKDGSGDLSFSLAFIRVSNPLRRISIVNFYIAAELRLNAWPSRDKKSRLANPTTKYPIGYLPDFDLYIYICHSLPSNRE